MYHMRSCCSWRPEEGIRTAGAGVPNTCKLLCGCWKVNLDLLKEQSGLLTTESFSQKPTHLFLNFYLLSPSSSGVLVLFQANICLWVWNDAQRYLLRLHLENKSSRSHPVLYRDVDDEFCLTGNTMPEFKWETFTKIKKKHKNTLCINFQITFNHAM